MRYRCTICHREATYNRKLGIHFCSQHGFSTCPELPGYRDLGRIVCQCHA